MLSALAQAYPGLKPYLDRYTVQSGPNLEYYQQGERQSPNPKLRILQLPENARPEDVAGEIVSHDLAQGASPLWTDAYKQFDRGMTPIQRRMLQEQYNWAVQNEGEQRPFDQWRVTAGQPAFFRGDLFHQWSDENVRDMYTPQQRDWFNKLRGAL